MMSLGKRRMEKMLAVNRSLRKGFRNVLKCSSPPAESASHRRTKFLIADFCWHNGLQFYTEESFTGGGRADVVIADLGVCVEVVNTESLSDFLGKRYPFVTIPVSASIASVDLRALLDELLLTNGEEDIANSLRKVYIAKVFVSERSVEATTGSVAR